MAELFANSGDPDQMPKHAASDLGLHILSVTLLGVPRLKWVNLYHVHFQGKFSRGQIDETFCIIMPQPAEGRSSAYSVLP